MVEIITEKFKLRSFKHEDAKNFHDAINTPQIARNTTIPMPWNLDSIIWWIGFINDAAKRQPLTEQHFVIEINGCLAGSVALINIDGHKGEIGYWLHEKYSGQGHMSEIIKIVTEYAFNNLKLSRLFAPVLVHNLASAKVLQKNNFLMEGILKNFYLKDGKLLDALCYAKVV